MKFGIDLGHGVGTDRGAVGNIAEETIINEVGSLVIKKLESLGHTVIELRPTSAINVNDSLNQRCNKADNYNVDMVVSIHANAGGGVGSEVFAYGGKEFKEAKDVLNGLVGLGFRNRGIKDGSNLAMVRRPKAKSMLIAICFVDSSDSSLYSSIGAEKIANVIVVGLTGETVVSGPHWVQNSTGWWYEYEDGTYPKDSWQKIDGKWYSFDSQGYARCNQWLQDNGKWYWLKSDCSMACNEWLHIDGKEYQFNSHGALVE